MNADSEHQRVRKLPIRRLVRLSVSGAIFLAGMLSLDFLWLPTSTAQVAQPFVTRVGTELRVGEAPFFFLGANAGVIHGPRSRSHVRETLDRVVQDGLSVIRIWALGEHPTDAPAWADEYAFRRGQDAFIESTFVHLDTVLDEARTRGLRVIIVLANRWNAYGGIAEYLRILGRPGPTDRQGHPTEEALQAFFNDPDAERMYQAHASRIITRRHARTGVLYRDDPTIMAFELINEVSVRRRYRDAMIGWIDRQSSYIRSLDPNHLISAGHIGYGTEAERQIWIDVHRLANIDYADHHAYPLGTLGLRTARHLERWVLDRSYLARHVIQKPLVFGEFGFGTLARTSLGRPRATWVTDFLRACHRTGVSGALIWMYAPLERTPMDQRIYTSPEHERRTADVRRAMRQGSRYWTAHPPAARSRLLTEAVSSTDAEARAPLWATRRQLTQTFFHRRWQGPDDARVLRINPLQFSSLDVEGGVWRSAPIEHVYGEGNGSVVFQFSIPRSPTPSTTVPRALRVRFRASGESPGASAPPDETSTVNVSLIANTTRRATPPISVSVSAPIPADDGQGQIIEVTFPPESIQSGAHTLTFSFGPNGLCLYGEASDATLAGFIELSLVPAAGSAQ